MTADEYVVDLSKLSREVGKQNALEAFLNGEIIVYIPKYDASPNMQLRVDKLLREAVRDLIEKKEMSDD